jgi:hypothetical protein
MGLRQPDFDRRLVDMEAIGNADVVATARFADSFEPRDTRLVTDEIAKTFAEGWQSGGQMQLMHEMEARDLVFGSARLRVADVKWLEPFSVKFYVPAYTRITNPTAETIEYAIRVPLSGWGGPYRLPPGRSHEFRVPYALIVRYQTRDGELTQTVSPGTQFVMATRPEDSSRPALEADSRAADGSSGSSTSSGRPRSTTPEPSFWR